jgi:exodeoxyribonuclease V alpha subunit
VYDETSGGYKTKMRFEPMRNASNPLPPSIRVIFIEEGSMLGTDLHKLLMDACPHNPQIIYLGDIQQLPPVFGPAILGFKLLELPVVELTEVYRQALESPIISLAHRILSGKPLELEEFPTWKHEGQMTLHSWKKKISALDATITLGNFFKQAYNKGVYNPDEDTILIPFNKACGTDEVNKIIANHLARTREEVTYQIIAGFQKVHLSVGDKVLYDKEDAIISKIEKNVSYSGILPIAASTTLDYWGYDSSVSAADNISSDEELDFILSQVASSESSEERVNKASHKVTVKLMDTEREVELESAGEINSLLLGYALTVHKAQGSEWRKVFLCIHQSHATMTSRELLYTAVTRAREELYVICEPDTFVKGILSQRVKGNTLEEKAEYFKGKAVKQRELLS